MTLPLRLVSPAEAACRLDPAFVGFAGHFPGAPVLPGMCQIDIAVRAASLALGAPHDLAAVERARFVRRVAPGEELTIRLAFDGPRVEARLFVGDEPAAELRLVLSPRPPSRLGDAFH